MVLGGIIIAEKEKETRNFALRDKDGNEIGVFTDESTRHEAHKAVSRGYIDIRFRCSVESCGGDLAKTNINQTVPNTTAPQGSTEHLGDYYGDSIK